MEEYPRTLQELEARFATEEACREYLARLCWSQGFVCPACEGAEAGAADVRGLWASGVGNGGHDLPGYTDAVGTLVPSDLVCDESEERNQCSWATAGAGTRELRNCMDVAPQAALRHGPPRGRDRLSGEVEVDETFIGGLEPGGGRRHIGKKALIAVAEEARGRGIGGIRLRRVMDSAAVSLVAFVQEAVTPGSLVTTDGWPSYDDLHQLGYRQHEGVRGLRPKGHHNL